MKKNYRIAPEVREQILKRIKEEGVSVIDAAKEHGVSEKTIYGWLGKLAECRRTFDPFDTLETPERGAFGARGRAHPQDDAGPKKELIKKQKHSQREIATQLGISRSSLYYVSKLLPKDWELKSKIELVLHDRPSYGYRRVAQELKVNKKRAQRVMKLFGMRAYRRRGRKPKKTGVAAGDYPNILKTYFPKKLNDIWVADFTYIPFQDKFIYLATVMDLFSREMLGWSVMANHSVMLVMESLFAALAHHERPTIFHSDNGREYGSKVFVDTLLRLGTFISRSAKASPWENGYQEAFYSLFKIDLGDPARFKTLGELVAEVHRLVWDYNHKRIHSALKMPPFLFAERYEKLSEKLSEIRGS